MVRLVFPLLLGFVVGSALQLQQETLFSTVVYSCFILLALALYALAALKSIASGWRIGLAALALALLAFGLTGLRASAFLDTALDPALEGRDVVITGVVAAMPQHNETGLRFRLEVVSAQLDGAPVRLPPRIYLGWYAGGFGGADLGADVQRQPAAIEAGERWRMAVRLKAPHGALNPFGFDSELWMWEQDLQASGYVRAGPKDLVPMRLAQTYRHPVEWARQQVRDQIYARVVDRKYAGLLAALVVGDQNAIDGRG